MTLDAGKGADGVRVMRVKADSAASRAGMCAGQVYSYGLCSYGLYSYDRGDVPGACTVMTCVVMAYAVIAVGMCAGQVRL